ncbi:RimK-like ATP-grasp domain-containing protein [Carnobacterium alterfunditum]|uniref:RimK-like ATP-grasp domain-containing protein n=1 Tax=Carnobacterium alterfunditum TaxID=28230 RepID=A0A1N6EJI3_9LACT|nr:alpha-L-glutamate ligase [Carnobacterium alterfunditum]SIN83209.1 RimK-like ATP-grasp domain-containing protein [Carnobacterium alterfunditum]
MKKIYVIHENNDWTRHLTAQLDEINAPYALWDLSDGMIDIQAEPPEGIFYNRMSASSHTRGHRYAPELTDNLLTWLESRDAVVFNGTKAIELEVSKLKQHLALQKNGIQTPETYGAVGKEQILKAAEKLNQFPFIIKHNRAGKGLGVRLLNSIAELKAYVYGLGFEDSIDGISLIQEYIKPADGTIVRSEFIGGKFFYAVKVDSSDGFELCPADSCQIGDIPATNKFTIIDSLPSEQVDLYEQFLKEQEIDVAAIEFIFDANGEAYAYDVNTNTNYNADAEKIAEKYAMLKLANFLKAELEKR